MQSYLSHSPRTPPRAVLTEFSALSADACTSCLNLLGMRVGKLFDADEIAALVATLPPKGTSTSGNATYTGTQLLAALRARQRSSPLIV